MQNNHSQVCYKGYFCSKSVKLLKGLTASKMDHLQPSYELRLAKYDNYCTLPRSLTLLHKHLTTIYF